MRLVLLVFLFCVCSIVGFAQPGATKITDDLSLAAGVKKHAGIDDIYRRFSKGYRDLDFAAVAGLYTNTAAYLSPEAAIRVGNAPILAEFEQFFTAVKNGGENMTVSFHIVQREVRGTMGYDVGIFTLKYYKDGKEIRSGQGKFIVVAVRNGNGWRFQVDGYSNLPKPAAK